MNVKLGAKLKSSNSHTQAENRHHLGLSQNSQVMHNLSRLEITVTKVQAAWKMETLLGQC